MAPGARLLIVEQLLPRGDALDPIAALMDLNMLVPFGGQERNADKYGAARPSPRVPPNAGSMTLWSATSRSL
jgi:hypothetical protein